MQDQRSVILQNKPQWWKVMLKKPNMEVIRQRKEKKRYLYINEIAFDVKKLICAKEWERDIKITWNSKSFSSWLSEKSLEM